MPPKKKKEDAEDLGAMKAARFGRVKNDLAMGFVGELGHGKILARAQSDKVTALHCFRFCAVRQLSVG